MLPVAKKFFYVSDQPVLVANPINTGQTEYKPVVETCVPLEACLTATRLLASAVMCIDCSGLPRVQLHAF